MKAVLVVFTLTSGRRVRVFAKPDHFGPFEEAALRLAGLKWAKDGGEVQEAMLPKNAGEPTTSDEQSVEYL